jgi:hypothetical protein
MGLLAWILRPSGLTHGSPPILLSESNRSSTHGTTPRQQPTSDWQVSFDLKNSNVPYCGEVA